MESNLFEEMNYHVIEWYKHPPCCQSNNLYIVLIAHSKSVLFVLQLDVDSVSTLEPCFKLN